LFDYFFQFVSVAGYVVEGIGVIVIIGGVFGATRRLVDYRRREPDSNAYIEFRHSFARAMLVGLEFLVAGDIIRTVVVSNTLVDIASLGLLVLIRTVLVFTMHLELHGRWPWQAETRGGE
jgi:uncharacterized membrane protein